MARDFNELKTRFEFYADDQVKNETALMLFNQCNEDISSDAGYAKTATNDFHKEVPVVSLPLDFLEMIELKIKRLSDNDYYRVKPMGLVQPEDFLEVKSPLAEGIVGYEVFGDSIEIRPAQEHDGTLLLRYYATLPTIKALTEIPIIKPAFHDIYALYAAAKYYQNYQDELPAKSDYYNEYMAKKMELKEYTDNARVRTKSKTVYAFRSWT